MKRIISLSIVMCLLSGIYMYTKENTNNFIKFDESEEELISHIKDDAENEVFATFKMTNNKELLTLDDEDMELFSKNMAAIIENNQFDNFVFQPEEKAICIYEGKQVSPLTAYAFAIYRETIEKNVIIENMLYVEYVTGDIYTWEGKNLESLTQIGVLDKTELSSVNIPDKETIDELMDKTMDLLIEKGNTNLKLIYDGMSNFATREYFLFSSFENNDNQIIREQTYYVDKENGNLYREEENNIFLRTELYYMGNIEISNSLL